MLGFISGFTAIRVYGFYKASTGFHQGSTGFGVEGGSAFRVLYGALRSRQTSSSSETAK